ncbi:hypothetical protein JCM10908_002853 [Rhodotorula pacifica]|uniref:uncharacterized protein n=1 Tax=Rhodotorula pacifica TaxID=1495444 RepID=UPI003180C26E
MISTAELPSIYTSIHELASPAIDLHARKLSSADRSTLDHLVQTCERGAAGTYLHSVLERSHEQTIRAWKYQAGRSRGAEGGLSKLDDNNNNEEDDDELELREKGYVHKRKPPPRKRRRSTSVAEGGGEDSSVASGEGDDEGGSDTEAAAAVLASTRSRKDKVRSTRRRVKRLRETLRIPDVELEGPDLPPDFPPSDLFTALHSRASNLYQSRHNLLPPLTPSAPVLSPSHQAHFNALHARINKAEERAIRMGTKDVVAAWKRTRIHKQNAGERRGIWTDARRAYEGSALVALGLLTQLLVEDAVNSEAERLPDLPLPPS